MRRWGSPRRKGTTMSDRGRPCGRCGEFERDHAIQAGAPVCGDGVAFVAEAGPDEPGAEVLGPSVTGPGAPVEVAPRTVALRPVAPVAVPVRTTAMATALVPGELWGDLGSMAPADIEAQVVEAGEKVLAVARGLIRVFGRRGWVDMGGKMYPQGDLGRRILGAIRVTPCEPRTEVVVEDYSIVRDVDEGLDESGRPRTSQRVDVVPTTVVYVRATPRALSRDGTIRDIGVGEVLGSRHVCGPGHCKSELRAGYSDTQEDAKKDAWENWYSRAVRAVVPGIAGLSAEDLADLIGAKAVRAQGAVAYHTGSKGGGGTGEDLADENQLKRIYAKTKGLGLDPEKWVAEVTEGKVAWNKKGDPVTMTKAQAAWLINKLAGLEKAAGGGR